MFKVKIYRILWPILILSIAALIGTMLIPNSPFSNRNYQIVLSVISMLCTVGLLVIYSRNSKNIKGIIQSLFVSIDSFSDIIDINIIANQKGIPAALERLKHITLNNIKTIRTNQENLAEQNEKLSIAYHELKESKTKYEKLLKNLEAEYFFYTKSPDNKYENFSPSVKKILGYNIEELTQLSHKLLTNKILDKNIDNYNQEITEGKAHNKYLVDVVNKNGQSHIFEIVEVPIKNNNGEIICIEGLAHDISQRYYAQEIIMEQEAKYRQIFNHASDFVFVYDIIGKNKSGKFIEVNNYMKDVLGYTDIELHEMTPENIEAAEIWNESHDKKPSGIYERIWETRDGKILNVEISEHIFNMKSKKACIAVARDISDRKRALEEIKFMNEELVNQKENLEALLDNLTQTQEQLVHSEKMAALGQLIAGVAHEINTPLGAIKASVGNLKDSLVSNMENLPILMKSGSPQSIDLFVKTIQQSQIKKTALSSREKREKKRELRKKLREENIKGAEMLADVLSYIEIYENIDNIFNLLQTTDALSVLNNVRNSVSLVKNTNTISIAAEKASKVVFALKKYAHRDSIGEKVPTDIIDGIETVLTLYDNQLKHGISVQKEYKDMPMVMCYQDEINQVWTNLIQNAIQAMGTHGTLTIKALANERQVEIIISDTGEGIEPTIIDKIFDPFFTTKKQGEGSGLGLNIVKKIIDKHGGEIHVDSQIGEGAKFTIQIPLY